MKKAQIADLLSKPLGELVFYCQKAWIMGGEASDNISTILVSIVRKSEEETRTLEQARRKTKTMPIGRSPRTIGAVEKAR